MKKIILGLFLLIFFSHNALAQTFTAKVNRSEIPAGEVVVLTLEYSGKQTNDTPNLSPLQKDFTIYDNAFSQNVYSTNGITTAYYKWEITLIPNAEDGSAATIPAIMLGNLTTAPLRIKINNKINTDSIEDIKYSIETKLDNTTPYINEQVKYSIIVKDYKSINITAPKFYEETIQDWKVSAIPTAKIETKTENSKTFREIIFEYVLFPQKSGSLTVPQARIDGNYDAEGNQTGRRRNSWSFSNFFVEKVPFNLITPKKTIEVSSAATNNWFPAKNVTLSASWNGDIKDIKAGDAISRTINIKAIGGNESNIPNIDFPEIHSMKQYPEAPEIEASIEDGNYVSTFKITNVYIPEEGGEFTIPKVEISWFNIDLKQSQLATLNEETIKVKESNGFVTYNNSSSLQTNINNIEETINPATNIYNNIFIVIIAFIFGFLLHYLFAKYRKTETYLHGKEIKQSNNYQDVIRSATNNDLAGLNHDLIFWARNKYSSDRILSLNDINKFVQNDDFATQLELISSALYSGKKITWNNQEFLKIFKLVHKSGEVKKSESSILPKLYK